MNSKKFGFELNGGGLEWSYPPGTPEISDDQARTIAVSRLAAAIDRLAEAVDRHGSARSNR